MKLRLEVFLQLRVLSLTCSRILLMCFILVLSACGGTSFRNRVCEPLKTIPKELDGTYNFAMPQDSMELKGYFVAAPQVVKFSSKENMLVALSNNGSESKLFEPANREAMDSLEGVEFCRDSKGDLWVQSFEEETHTWSIAGINLQENGFSIQELSFPLQSLADLKLRYLILDEGWESFKGTMGSNGPADVIVDNSKMSRDDSKEIEALLSLGKPSAVMIYFARVPPTLELQKRLSQNGKKFFYGTRIK
jgi:hypothetical protein